MTRFFALLLATVLLTTSEVRAEDLYGGSPWAALASDHSAQRVGDIVTVIVYQAAEARNAAQSRSRARRDFDGAFRAGSTDEAASLSLNGGYDGQGEITRSESFVTRISVTVEAVLDNGDLLVAGAQRMEVNGEETLVRIRGRIRPEDVNADNEVLSTRIADAEIAYGGHGFVSRNSRPNWLHRIFALMGLGG